MSELKVGDKVFIGPFEILQFRDTNRPGPQDTGDSIIVTRGDHGALSADTSLTIPAVPNLAAVARVIAAHPGIGAAINTALDLFYEIGSFNVGEPGGLEDKHDNRKLMQRMPTAAHELRALAAALNGGGE